LPDAHPEPPAEPAFDLAWTLVAVLALIGLGIALAPAARPKPPTEREIRRALLAELQPVALKNCTLERIGSVYDGGYLMCGNLLGNVQSAYSYGIGTDDHWGCQMSTRLRVPVHEYDCFSPNRFPCADGQAVFHNECIGPKSETIESRVFDTLANQIASNGDSGKTLVLKIDVEGAELRSLMATPPSVLDRIDQLTMEIHGTDERFLALVRKLKRQFHLIHLHFNNQACGERWYPLPAWAYQVSFVNKRIGELDPAAPKVVLPRPLDKPDFSVARDCQATGPIE
jgi:hypothetical protein